MIIGNQKELMKTIDEINEKIDSHDKKLDLLFSHDNVEVVKTTNKKKAKDGFTVSMRNRYWYLYLVIHVIHTLHNYYLFGKMKSTR